VEWGHSGSDQPKDSKMSNVRGKIAVANDQTSDLVFRLEPWGREYEIPPGKKLIVAFYGPHDGTMEIITKPGAIELWGWTGSTMDITE
jgi:hypothetical protein